MGKLHDIAENCVNQTGIFQNFKTSSYTSIDQKTERGSRQIGVVRVNCVDCLDRTNTAMYVIGKCAFAHQVRFFYV